MAIFLIILLIIFIFIFVYIDYSHSMYVKSIVIRIDEFDQEINMLRKNYISDLEKRDLIKKYKSLRNDIISRSDERIKNFIFTYDNIDDVIEKFNEEFINKEMLRCKKFFDSIFKYPIDEEQRRAIVTDDNNNLIIAGAGSGKTTTIIGKTKYLIEEKGVKPEEIITISFTNAAKDNFIEKLNDSRVYCSTFHKLGKDILEEDSNKLDIADSDYLEKVVREYMSDELYRNSDHTINFINFYSYYMHLFDDNNDNKFGDIIEQIKGFDLETLKSKCTNLKTLKSEKVKSEQELVIANYLFLHGIKYEYEPKYKYEVADKKHRQYHPDFYLVDYDIYLEHFGINKEGRAPQYNEVEEKKYLDEIISKRNLHEQYGTRLLETYSYDFDNYDIDNILEKKLISFGVVFKDIDYKEIAEIIIKSKSYDISEFYKLICKFIKLFKGNNYDIDKFDSFYLDAVKKKNKRNIYLIKIIKDIFIYYESKLKEEKYIDFDDMINLATEKVNNSFNKKISYIIIDEFQDISYSRYMLIKAIQNKTNAKVIAVGDDWQSIYRFTGCDLDLFVNFDKYFKNPKIMYITNTYRNCQNLINISGNFIMKNEKGQIKKSIKSNSNNIDSPIEFYYYKNDIIRATSKAISYLKKTGCKKIAVLGRNNSDIKKYGLEPKVYKKEIELKAFGDDVYFTTVHKSKGLEYDGVILCNLANYITGFPNKMSDDPVLNYVSLSKDNYLYEEERRLFYVALTRTKTKCILLVPIINPSIFIDELVEISENSIKKTIIEDDERLHNPNCPKCNKGILVIRNNNDNNAEFVGCSNYPFCDFKYKNDDIIKDTVICPRCGSFMVKRKGRYGEFYGCINYPDYCNQTIESDSNYNYINYKKN